MTAADIRKVVINWFVAEALNTGNVGTVDELFAANYLSHVPARPEPLRGVAAWQERTAAYRAAFPDFHVTIEDVLAEAFARLPEELLLVSATEVAEEGAQLDALHAVVEAGVGDLAARPVVGDVVDEQAHHPAHQPQTNGS